ncbi:MAG: DNA-directed RNA polymerase specialized sigma24 family protein [Maribacter sp.]
MEEDNESDYFTLQKALATLPAPDRELIVLNQFQGIRIKKL